MENKFYYHLHRLITIRKRAIIFTINIFSLLLCLFIALYNLELMPFAYGSLFILLVLIVILLFIQNFKSLHYFKSVYALPIEDSETIRPLLTLVEAEAIKLKRHFILRRQANHFLEAVKAFEAYHKDKCNS